MPSLSSPFVASPRPAGRGEAPNYRSRTNLKVKVLDFVKSGGPERTVLSLSQKWKLQIGGADRGQRVR